MAAVYGTLSKFNPQTQSWEDYTEVMGHYFTANEIKEDKKNQAIFLASVGDKIYALIKSLCQPGSPGDKKFDELVALVQEHFTPKPSEIVQRYKFYTRTRQAGETVHQFVAALRNLSKHCNFGSTLNIMMASLSLAKSQLGSSFFFDRSRSFGINCAVLVLIHT